MFIVQEEEYLEHVGVRGMKWGVHKKYFKDHMESDRTLKKGFEIQNISSDKRRDISKNNPVYGSHTNHDKNAYGGYYAKNIQGNGSKAYVNSLVLMKDVNIPSQKKSVDIFMKLYNEDPKGMSESIGKAYAELSYFNKVDKFRNYNANRISVKMQKQGEDWVENKGYLLFNQSMMAPKEKTARVKYYDLLMKKGYTAISDVNDVQTGYGSDDPIIFINPKKTMKNVTSRQLNSNEVELASARYEYDEAVKGKGIVDTLLYGQYATAKKELKRVEKKQAKMN